ncbi:WAT1-related protein [Glycine soja]
MSHASLEGTVLSIAGALLVTLYKGSPIISFRTQPSPTQPLPPLLAETSNWVIGGLFFATASISLAAWNITQAAILKGYSSQLTILAYYCLFGTIQSAILSLIVVRDPNDWKISPDIDLIAAVVGSVVTFSVNTWCIKKKGPVFVSLFKPVGIAIAAFSTVVFLGETLHVGSVVGAVIIAIGFYTVLWAQSKEENAKGLQVDRLSSPSAQASPLLEFHESNGEKEKEKDQMGVKRNLVEWTPFIAMATVECLDVELSTLSKAAMSRGMNHFVLVGYSNALATLILLPSPFFIDSYTLTFS